MKQDIANHAGVEMTMDVSSDAGLQGVAGMALRALQRLRSQGTRERRQLRVIESLALGGKRQLMLVECAGAKYLIGGGVDSVHSIVPLRHDSIAGVSATGDGACD